jgi:hypothetical protein
VLSEPNRHALRIALATGAALVIWLLIANLLVPIFVEQAHQGALPAVLNDLLPRRATLSVEHYLARVHRISLTVCVIMALGGLALIAASRPRVHRQLEAWRTSSVARRRPDRLPMTGRRWLVVNALIAVLLGGNLFDILTTTEHWPFSHYGMYSGLAPRHVSAKLSLYGVTEAGTVSLNVPGYFAPLDDQRLRATIRSQLRRPEAGPAVEEVLRYAGARYEQLRQMGAHDGSRLLAVRLVEASWTKDPWTQNRESPDVIQQLYEVRIGDGNGPSR